MITDNTAKWRVGSISTPQVNSGDGLLPVGHVYISMGSSAPAGSLPLWGQLFSRETYKDLWEWVNLHPEQLLSESAWQTKFNENRGYVPFYSEGTDSTNFRVPNCVTFGTNEADFVIESGKDGLSWWRIWGSGWIEQGGYLKDPANTYLTVDSEYTVYFPKPMANTQYIVNNTVDCLDTNPGVQSGTMFTIAPSRGINSVQLSTEGLYTSSVYGAYWEVKGYTSEVPSKERNLWCVKAFGNIDESTGSTSLTNIANNITQLNTKVDNWVSGTLDSHATAIAKMQSYFNDSMEEILLFDSLANSSNWTGNIAFSDSYLNYDFIRIEFATGYAVGSEYYISNYYSTKWIADGIQKTKDEGLTYYAFPIPVGLGSWYWRLNTSTSSEVLWNRHSHGSIYPRRVWGYKLKANGITNKSAIDVSQISGKISSLLTSDNHLRLPSGLEVW